MTQYPPTPYDAVVPYTRTVHNRVEGYRRCQADYAPLLEAAKAVLADSHGGTYLSKRAQDLVLAAIKLVKEGLPAVVEAKGGAT